jgi:AAA family ATP:ADP antiporter
VHKLLAGFGSTAVFGAGTVVAAAFALGAWKVAGEAKKLPEARSR